MTTLASLLHPAYELCADGGATADGAQLVDGEWRNPLFGCDSLQFVVDNARALLNDTLAPRVAMPWPEPKADAPSDPVQAVMNAAMGRDGEPIPRVAAAVICAAADYIDSMIKCTDSEDFAEGLHSAACLLNVIAKQLEKTVNE